MKKYKVPTGHICTVIGEKNKPLEFLSIGDYGKEKNLKADFLGLSDEINGVPHGDLLPLEKKWVVTISSQYGCSMGCTFCDVPKVGKGINATFQDLINQVDHALELHPEVKYTERLNLHYARMGEPTFNYDVVRSAYYLAGKFEAKNFGFHPVVSTVMPYANSGLKQFLVAWLQLKNTLGGEAGLQLSINTTDESRRMFSMPHSLSLAGISDMMKDVLRIVGGVEGRKITLNFAITDAEVDANVIGQLFDPKCFICKITPMHETDAVIQGGMITNDGYDHYYPYKEVEENLKREGFDVLVFVPSVEEDESKITCGNAILASSDNA